MTEGMTLRTWVCVGLAGLSKTKRTGVLFRDVLDDGKLGDAQHAFERKKELVMAHPGNVYSVEANETSIVPSTLRFVRRWDNEQDVLKWQVESDGYKAELKRRRLLRDSKFSQLAQKLEPIRTVYNRLSFDDQHAMEVAILRYLRYGRL